MKRTPSFALLVSLSVWAVASPASAGPISLGEEFIINTYYTGAQRRPAVASNADGSFVVVWESLGQDSDDYGVFGQRYAGDGAPAGTEFSVNTYVPLRQGAADVATTGDGSFVVVWESNGQDGFSYGVFGQRFDQTGALFGTEFQINTYFTGPQRAPSLAELPGGGFVVVWNGYGAQDLGYGIFGQIFGGSGDPVGSEFHVNAFTTGGQYAPRIDSDDAGGFVVVWGSNDGRDGDGYGVFGQRFGSDGLPAGTEFLVNDYTTADQRIPDVAVAGGGAFTVVWQSYGVDMSAEGIGGRRYDASGAALAGEFGVNTYAYDDQRYPRIAADSAGGFVVAWESEQYDGDAQTILAQQFDDAGATTGPEFQVNTFIIGGQREPAIAASEAGAPFVVAWESAYQDGSLYSIFGQRYLETTPLCGDVIVDGSITATDALAILRASVGIFEVLLCVGDVNSSGAVTATDALIVLRKAVGQSVALTCPSAC